MPNLKNLVFFSTRTIKPDVRQRSGGRLSEIVSELTNVIEWLGRGECSLPLLTKMDEH
ncbi:hypothetical protein IV46_GL000102 [Limosilactobacillus fermentum]|nr:hypothetical protein IV46_GL000102 [Limosilactobacillus fermentum]